MFCRVAEICLKNRCERFERYGTPPVNRTNYLCLYSDALRIETLAEYESLQVPKDCPFRQQHQEYCIGGFQMSTVAPAGGANLTIREFEWGQHQWMFKFKYFKRSDENRRIKFTNDLKLIVRYFHGVALECKLSMNMVNIEKLGKRVFLGVDLSEGAKKFVEFIYEKERINSQDFKLCKVEVDASKVLELYTVKGGKSLIEQIDVPFPVEDILNGRRGKYWVPYFTLNNTLDYFIFPDNIQAKKNIV